MSKLLNHRYRRINTARFIKHKEITERITRTRRGLRASEFRNYREAEIIESYDDDADYDARLSATA